MKIKRQTLNNLIGMMMVVVVPQMQNTLKNQMRSSELLPLMLMMIEVKVASLTAVVSFKYLQLNHKMNLNYYSSVNYLH
jgi:hypothetical protein